MVLGPAVKLLADPRGIKLDCTEDDDVVEKEV
jgi:hypothetical protein